MKKFIMVLVTLVQGSLLSATATEGPPGGPSLAIEGATNTMVEARTGLEVLQRVPFSILPLPPVLLAIIAAYAPKPYTEVDKEFYPLCMSVPRLMRLQPQTVGEILRQTMIIGASLNEINPKTQFPSLAIFERAKNALKTAAKNAAFYASGSEAVEFVLAADLEAPWEAIVSAATKTRASLVDKLPTRMHSLRRVDPEAEGVMASIARKAADQAIRAAKKSAKLTNTPLSAQDIGRIAQQSAEKAVLAHITKLASSLWLPLQLSPKEKAKEGSARALRSEERKGFIEL